MDKELAAHINRRSPPRGLYCTELAEDAEQTRRTNTGNRQSPWVTNPALGSVNGTNLPAQNEFPALRRPRRNYRKKQLRYLGMDVDSPVGVAFGPQRMATHLDRASAQPSVPFSKFRTGNHQRISCHNNCFHRGANTVLRPASWCRCRVTSAGIPARHEYD